MTPPLPWLRETGGKKFEQEVQHIAAVESRLPVYLPLYPVAPLFLECPLAQSLQEAPENSNSYMIIHTVD